MNVRGLETSALEFLCDNVYSGEQFITRILTKTRAAYHSHGDSGSKAPENQKESNSPANLPSPHRVTAHRFDHHRPVEPFFDTLPTEDRWETRTTAVPHNLLERIRSPTFRNGPLAEGAA